MERSSPQKPRSSPKNPSSSTDCRRSRLQICRSSDRRHGETIPAYGSHLSRLVEKNCAVIARPWRLCLQLETPWPRDDGERTRLRRDVAGFDDETFPLVLPRLAGGQRDPTCSRWPPGRGPSPLPAGRCGPGRRQGVATTRHYLSLSPVLPFVCNGTRPPGMTRRPCQGHSDQRPQRRSNLLSAFWTRLAQSGCGKLGSTSLMRT